jgi:hypothetical protein
MYILALQWQICSLKHQDLQDRMTTSPSLPKDEWLSPKWFNAYEGALEAAESADGYIGYVDEYMWPVGRAAGRVIKENPELHSSNIQWEVINVPGGQRIVYLLHFSLWRQK